MTTETQGDHFDLLVIPQLDHQTPAPHLTAAQFEQARNDWAHYESPPPNTASDTWTVALAHLIDGKPHITATIRIPKR